MVTETQKEKLSKVFRKYGVVLAYLFGSAARGKVEPLSDVDVAVLFSKKAKKEGYFDKILKLEEEIDKILGIYKTQVTCLNEVHSF